jgi:hypothetical protein
MGASHVCDQAFRVAGEVRAFCREGNAMDDGVDAKPALNDLGAENIDRAPDTMTAIREPQLPDIEPAIAWRCADETKA